MSTSGNQSGETSAHQSVQIDHVNFIAVNVVDLRRAEAFYTGFFDMVIAGRTLTRPDGKYTLLDADSQGDRATATESAADDSYLRNGELCLGLHRVSPGARLDRSQLSRVSIQVSAATYARMKAQVLVKSLEILGETQASFIFRDPFGVPWEIALPGLLPHVLRESLNT